MLKFQKNNLLKMVKFKLDPRMIIGEIDSCTPLCVVRFVATLCFKKIKEEYWGNLKYMNDFLEIVNSSDFFEVDIPLKQSCKYLQECIFFLNPFSNEKTWEFQAISDGINSIFEIINNEVKYENLDFVFGSKTSTAPKKINELLCYKLCKHYSYQTNIHTTFEEMSFAVLKLSKTNELPLLRKVVIENMKYVSDQKMVKYAFEMLSIDNSNEYEIANEIQSIPCVDIIIDQKNIVRTNNILSNVTVLQQRISPNDSVEAILLAMARFNICIAEARTPIKQFKFLVSKKFNAKNIHEYVPIDDYNFCINYTRNPKWYSTNSNWFHELLPIYTTQQLLDFCKREGFIDSRNVTDNKQLISYLKSLKTINWIYFGIVPFCSKTKTLIYKTPIDEINPFNLVCIGNILEDNLEYFSLDELTAYFNSKKIFINPVDNEPLSLQFINKLKYNSMLLISHNISDRHIYTDLVECIENLEKIKDLIDYKVRELKIIIDNSNNKLKEHIKSFFEKCIDMAFYMRGWNINGKNDLPLKSEDTYYEALDPNEEATDNQRQVWVNVCHTHVDIIKLYRELPRNISDGIASLRLVRFSRIGELKNIFGLKIRGASVSQTTTLMECMNISVYGDKDSEDTCIRSNSNWILFTAAWYSYIFGFELKFRFDRIDEIS